MDTRAIFFPFDLFGSAGAADGVRLLADAVRELLADNRRERVPTRAAAYAGRVRLRELAFAALADYDGWRERAQSLIRRSLDQNEFVFWFAGNHLGVLPVYDVLADAGKETLVVQFDAHLDVYNLTDCTSELSHGNFLLHCAGPLPPIVNLGTRELLLRPEHVRSYYRQVFPASDLAIDPEPALRWLRQASARAKRVFLDLDCDVFDRAYFPAVSHPLPFGLSPQLLLRLLDALWNPRVVGLAVSEFDPGRDRADQSLGTLLWLVEYLLLRCYERAP
jgi:arginase family enzyme